MVQEPLTSKQRLCEVCGEVIPEVRLNIIPSVRICVRCQEQLERRPPSGRPENSEHSAQGGEEPVQPVEIKEDRIVTRDWSGGLMELATTSGTLRTLLGSGKKEEARSLVQALPVEAQAALVVLDEDPEEALSLTGMDNGGNPGYSTDVVALLPTEMLTGLIAYDRHEKRLLLQVR